MRRTGRLLAASLLVVVSSLAGSAAARPQQAATLNIYAAASLTEVFRALDPGQRYNFAGSNRSRPRSGRAPRRTSSPPPPRSTLRTSSATNLVQKPRHVHREPLALIVPKSNPAEIRTVFDLARSPAQARVAAPDGAGRRLHAEVLTQAGRCVGAAQGRQPGVGRERVTGKLALGEAEAGFVYVTDARAGRRRLTAIRIPALGAAARPLRGRDRLALDNKAAAQRSSTRCSAPTGQAALKRRLRRSREEPALEPFALALSRRPRALVPSAARSCRLPRVPPDELLDGMNRRRPRDALLVTLKTTRSRWSILLFGTPAAYWIATHPVARHDVLVTLIELPLVLPPAVAGIGLLAAFGRFGLLGGTLDVLGFDSPSPSSRSSSRSCSSPARSTSAPRSRPSSSSTRH